MSINMNEKDIIEDYLIYYELPYNKNSIFKSNNNITKSIIQSYPQINNGYHYWIHDLKKEKEQFIKFENKKKIYNVLNKFDINIDDNEKDIVHNISNHIVPLSA